MADNVDDRVVNMKFNNAAFESKVSETIKSLDRLQKSLDLSNSAKGLQNLDVSGASASLNTMASSVEDISSKFSAMGAVAFATISRITNSAIDMATNVGKSLTIAPISAGFQEFELKMGSVQTIMAGSGAGLDEVNSRLQQLNEYSDKTIYSFRDMTSNIGKFTNAGVSLEKSVSAIQGIANVAAISGANAEEASRAMYNFAQALSSGHVKLVDWKSIELANMATVEFKQQLIDTAVAMGTLTKSKDGYETSAGTFVSATRGFNDSLTDQWLTSEALTTTLGKYTDQTTDLGKKASAAAQDVKTFSQMMATLKESAASGWAQTFEIIFGNFEEGKELWTGINNAIGGFINNLADARNELLNLWKWFGGRKELIDTFKEVFSAADGIAKIFGTIADAFRHVFPPMTVETLLKITHGFSEFLKKLKPAPEVIWDLHFIFRGLFSILEIGWTILKETAKFLLKLIAPLDSLGGGGIKALNFIAMLFDQISKLSELLTGDGGGISKFFDGLTVSLTPITRFIGKLIGNIVGLTSGFSGLAIAAKQLFNIIAFGDVTVGPFAEDSKFVDILFDIREAMEKAIKTAKMFFDILFRGDFKGGPFSEDSKIVDILFDIREAFEKVFNSFVSHDFATIFEAIQSAIGDVKDAFVGFSFSDIFGEDSDKASESLDKITEKFEAFKTISAFDLGDSPAIFGNDWEAKSSGIIGFFQTIEDYIAAFIDTIKMYSGKIHDGVGSLSNAVTKFFTGNELVSTQSAFENFVDVIQAILVSGILYQVFRFFQEFKKLVNTAEGTLASLKDILNRFGKETKSTTLIKIGIALVLLAVGLKKIADIPADRLATSLGAAGAGLAAMMGALFGMNKFIKGGDSLKSTATSLILVAVGVRLLAEAVKAFSEIDPDKLKQGMISAGLALAALAASVNLMRNSVNPGTALVVIALAGAMFLVAKAIDDFAKFDPGELAKGIAAMAVAMAGIGFALSMMGPASILAAPAMVIVALALGLIADGIERFSGMKDLDKGIAAMFFALLAIAAPLKILGPEAILGAAGIYIVVKAIEILVGVIEEFGSMDVWSLNKALMALGVTLALIAVASIAMGDPLVLLGAASMLIVAGALVLLTDVLERLGKMKLTSIITAIGALVVVFVGLAAAGVYLSLPIAALGAAMLLLGGGMLLFGGGVYLATKAFEILADVANEKTNIILAVLEKLAHELPRIGVIFVQELAKSAKELAKSAITIQNAFADMIVGFLEAIIKIIPKISQTVDTIVTAILTFIGNRIVDFVEMGFKILLALGQGLMNNVGELTILGVHIVAKFLASLADNAYLLIEAGVNLILSLINGLGARMGAIVDRGGDLIIYLLAGIAAKTIEVVAAAGTILIGFLNALTKWIKENSQKIHDAGVDLAKAIAEGIVVGLIGEDNKKRLIEAIKKMAGLLPEWAQKVLGVKSPSTVFQEIGGHIGAGLALGLDNDSLAKNAAVQHAERVVEAFSKTLGTMPNALDGMGDLNPVITPVLDLTKVAAGARGLNDIMATTPISPDVSLAQARLIATTTGRDEVSADSQNGSSPTEVTFIQNNYSPKELSTNDIYRNQKSQFALAKEELGI